MSVELKPCPACGYEAIDRPSQFTPYADCPRCHTRGPYDDDPTGAKWNQLPRRTPGTIEVPESEVEALRPLAEKAIVWNGTALVEKHANLATFHADRVALNAIIARLPPREPDHVVGLRDLLRRDDVGGIFDPEERAHIEAAIAAMGYRPHGEKR